METLAQMISNETRTQATKDGVASIDAKGKERAEINEKKLEEIMDRLDPLSLQGIWHCRVTHGIVRKLYLYMRDQ